MTVHCFTSITNNYIPKARILEKTLKKYNPEWIFHVVLSEPLPENYLQEKIIEGNIIYLEDLEIPKLDSWIFKHKVTEICTAVKGQAAAFLFEKMGAEKIVYLDPDIAVFNSLQPIADLLDQHPVILAPHLSQPEKDRQDVINNEIGSLRHGVFNLGFFAVKNQGQGKDFINWWRERTLEFCWDDIPYGLFTDQRWCDFAPIFFDDLYILRDPEYDVATWNLSHRTIEMSDGGVLLVDGNPLRFYHFTGYDSGAGRIMVEYSSQRRQIRILKEIWDWYDRQLIDHGQRKYGSLEWLYNRFDNRVMITNEMRAVYRTRIDVQESFPDPFTTQTNNGGFLNWWRTQYPLEAGSTVNGGKNNRIELLEGRSDIYMNLLENTKREHPDEYIPLTLSSVDGASALVKLIAFYLPQYHPIPENDEWWGKGFTEWTNVTKAVPQFPGHYQPHLPDELGFYDLRIPEVQKRQVELAKQYGLAGFSFYYYWFSGKRLLEKPIDQFLANKQLDFPFCLIWANENWTRRWDGLENDVLMRQVHTPQTDVEFIQSVEPYMLDDRYIRFGDRPVLIVYRVDLMPDPEATAERWREYCLKRGLGNPYLMAAQTFGFEDPTVVGFDAAIQFPPHNQHQTHRFSLTSTIKSVNPNFESSVYSYPELVKYKESNAEDAPYPLFKSVFPCWDNEPRKPGRSIIFTDCTPALYKRWLQTICRWTIANHPPEERYAFINAWNEWGESAHLEPDRRFGYAYLQATMDVVKRL